MENLEIISLIALVLLIVFTGSQIKKLFNLFRPGNGGFETPLVKTVLSAEAVQENEVKKEKTKQTKSKNVKVDVPVKKTVKKTTPKKTRKVRTK